VGAYANVYWYEISPCRAIDISLTDAGVIDFLESTNMATVNVRNCKNYQGHNTWLVCWYTQTQSQKVYVDIYTGEIIGTAPDPEPSWHTVTTFQGRYDRKTPDFNIKGDTWRMVWEAVGTEDDSYIHVTVNKCADFSCQWVDQFKGDNNFPFSDTYCVYTGPGTYNINVISEKLEYWSITVEDFY